MYLGHVLPLPLFCCPPPPPGLWSLEPPRFCLLSKENGRNFGFHLKQELGGAGPVVCRVEPGTSAQRQGLQEGDRILGVNNHVVEHEEYAVVRLGWGSLWCRSLAAALLSLGEKLVGHLPGYLGAVSKPQPPLPPRTGFPGWNVWVKASRELVPVVKHRDSREAELARGAGPDLTHMPSV